MAKIQNQQNPPPPKSKCVDKEGNVFKKFAVCTLCKDGKSKSTTPIISGLTDNECLILEATLKSFVSHTKCGKILVDFTTFK